MPPSINYDDFFDIEYANDSFFSYKTRIQMRKDGIYDTIRDVKI